MNFEAALTVELKTITALNNRIYPLTAPEEPFDLTIPYLIFVTSEGLRSKDLDGYRTGKTVRGELNVIAPRYSDMKSITSSVIDKMISMERRTIATVYDSTAWQGADTAWNVTDIRWDGVLDEGPYIQEFVYEEPAELYEDKPKLYRCVIDFEVYF